MRDANKMAGLSNKRSIQLSYRAPTDYFTTSGFAAAWTRSSKAFPGSEASIEGCCASMYATMARSSCSSNVMRDSAVLWAGVGAIAGVAGFGGVGVMTSSLPPE